ncbi:DUF2652 domain-containing protein [Dongia sp.]|uniref:DUF2652 domain-containing protein n=1 Tax=Dongia sp. TaxID=1977262 RepID=UPI0037504023
MLAQPESACFLIADISGYTSFLAGVELDHAHDIIADVMDTVLKRLRPKFRLAKFEGDAAFVYAVGDKIDGSMVQDAIEAAYFAFRRRLRDISQSTTCTCKACAKMRDLDLKFVAHYGQFIKHKMAGREELAGSDVIVVHRLLKNGVNERLGGRAYALFSDACIRAMGVDPAAQGLIEHRETIDIIGETVCWVRDLEAAWTEEDARPRNEVTREKSAFVLEFDFAFPRPLVWEYFTMPDLRPKWRAANEVREATAGDKRGRRGVGTVNHCMHGAAAIIEEILDWRPFDTITLTTLVPMPDAPKILMGYAFIEQDGGTHVEIRIAKPKPKDQAFLDKVVANFKEHITHEVEVLHGILAERLGAPSPLEEPVISTSAGRFLSQPVAAS